MNITVERVDEINTLLSGEVEESFIPTNIERKEAEEKSLQLFIEKGIEKAGVSAHEIFNKPHVLKYEQREKGIYFEVIISMPPKINANIDYADITPQFEHPVASKEEVEAELKALVQDRSRYVPLKTPRAVKNGDMVLIDFEGFLNNVAFEGGKAEKFVLEIGSNSFIAGFEEQIVGMEYGEERTIKVMFPENYGSEDLAGKEATFNIKLHEIQEQHYVALNDAFAQEILNDPTATLDTFRKKLEKEMNSQALFELYQNELKPKVIKGLLSKFDFTLPANIIELEIDAKVNEKVQTMTQEEQEAYKKDQSIAQELRESVTAEAKEAIKAALIIDALVTQEKIQVTEQEVNAALHHQAATNNQNADELIAYYQENNFMDAVKMKLAEEKLFGMILGLNR